MTRDDIIRMAREAEFYDGEIYRAEDAFVHFAALVAAAEREMCALMVMPVDESLADAIRARGQE